MGNFVLKHNKKNMSRHVSEKNTFFDNESLISFFFLYIAFYIVSGNVLGGEISVIQFISALVTLRPHTG